MIENESNNSKLLDHLFRHQSGKMVAVLTRIFGLSNLELIEDAVQDTFIKAMSKWQMQLPDQPEAWLMTAAKNRAIDLMRSGKVQSDHLSKVTHGSMVNAIDDLFENHQIQDSQLRMIFTACHPELSQSEQIAFALKAISGFGDKEIATALLSKTDTIKKRLSRARKIIKEKDIQFSIPDKRELPDRLDKVYNVLYLLFNEGYHSAGAGKLIRKEVCFEAIRLAKLLLEQKEIRTGKGYALFSLFCFHGARIDSRLSQNEEVIELKLQDRSKWNDDLIELGNHSLNKAMDFESISKYHLEAAVLGEHLNASTFEETNWDNILNYYNELMCNFPSEINALNIAITMIQLKSLDKASDVLKRIDPLKLGQRSYLYYATKAALDHETNDSAAAMENIQLALDLVKNEQEKAFLLRRLTAYKNLS